MNILLTGGAGYIGSHTAIALIEIGHNVLILDNFCNSNPSVLERLEKIAGIRMLSIRADVRDIELVEKVLREHRIDIVIHFAGLKAVGESCKNALEYYSNNVCGAISLIKAMEACNVKKLVFSSSATVYGDPQYLPIDEFHPTVPTNPYGRNKLQIEEFLRDVAASDPGWHMVSFRYFNPVGAHVSGLIGEDPRGTPNNLMPYISKVASGKLPYLHVYGNDYQTIDGTGVRDYIHVMDLAEGHVAVLPYLNSNPGYEVVNLGTGSGYSVMQILSAYEGVCGKPIPFKFVGRRQGDIAACYANPEKAKSKFGWVARRTLADMTSSQEYWVSK